MEETDIRTMRHINKMEETDIMTIKIRCNDIQSQRQLAKMKMREKR
jgi:hypothetical protein